MDTITFNLPEDLKLAFQVKTIKQKTTMTDELVKFVKQYVSEE